MAAQTDTNDHIAWEKYSQWCSKCCYSVAGSYTLKHSDKSCVLDIVVATNTGAYQSLGVPHAQKTQSLLLTSDSVPLVFESTAAIFSPLLTSFLLGQFMYSLGEQAQSPPQKMTLFSTLPLRPFEGGVLFFLLHEGDCWTGPRDIKCMSQVETVVIVDSFCLSLIRECEGGKWRAFSCFIINLQSLLLRVRTTKDPIVLPLSVLIAFFLLSPLFVLISFFIFFIFLLTAKCLLQQGNRVACQCFRWRVRNREVLVFGIKEHLHLFYLKFSCFCLASLCAELVREPLNTMYLFCRVHHVPGLCHQQVFSLSETAVAFSSFSASFG